MIHVLFCVSYEKSCMLEGCTYLPAMKPDIAELVMPTELEVDIPMFIKEVHLKYVSALTIVRIFHIKRL